MGRRERRGFGSVRRLSSGRWQVRYRDLSGVMHTGPHTFASKTDASRYLAMVEADLRRGAWADPKLSRITLTEWAKRWQATTTKLRPTTRDLYAYLLRRFLLPTFGKRSMSSIDVLTVRSWLASLEDQGVSTSTRAKAYRLLTRNLGAAVEAGYLLRNPCTVKGLVRSEHPRCGSPPLARPPRWPSHRPSLSGVGPGGRIRGLRWGSSWDCGSGALTCCMAG